MPLPAADLLMTSYDELMEGVYDSKDLGSGVINGAECDSLAFRKDDVDFQIWVAHGEQSYPCRMVITSTQVDGGPEYSVQIRDWKTGEAVAVDELETSLGRAAENLARVLEERGVDVARGVLVGRWAGRGRRRRID